VLLLAAGAAAAEAPEARPVEVRASAGGFTPSRLTLRQGETTRILLTSADSEHCFAVDALRVEKRIVPGRATAVELAPDRAGAFAFHCCLHPGEAERGEIEVVE
jgi:cytochrome c oxidase subunit 2